MATRSLAREEKYALPVAVALHVALALALLWQPASEAIVQPPERIAINFTDETGLTSTSPAPVPDAAPPAASNEPAFLEDVPAPPIAEPIPQPRSEPPPRPRSEPVPRPRAEPVVRPTTRAEPRRREPTQRSEPRRRSEPTREQRQSSPAKSAPPKSEIGSDFLGGGTNRASENTGTPGNEIGPKEQNAINAAIIRQLKPHWSAPQGVDVELLVTRVRFRLNRDGTLNGTPQILSQTGGNAANAAQSERHKEQAIRAIRLAAPFRLPEEYYDGWKTVTTNFDRRL